MASAILPSRNEPRSSGFMSKFTNNGNRFFNSSQNVTNLNPNPNSSHTITGNTSRDVLWQNHEPLPSSPPPKAAFIGSSTHSVSSNSSGYRYITFRVRSYTRRELEDLKKRLTNDLERVRVLRHSISTTPIPKKKYRPSLELPTAPEVDLTRKERQKSAVGQKRKKPSPAVRDTKKYCGRVKNNAQRGKVAMRKCGQILTTLKKHKNGWVFNRPVDAVSLKLYDYHSIITNPMDLGTIEKKLAKNEYESPLAFASDVRLTFQNAMVYNGPGSDVFDMAERLLSLFEEMFNRTSDSFVGTEAKWQQPDAKKPFSVEKPVSNPVVVSENPVSNVTTWNPTAPQVAANLGKPTARDAISSKREMTANEKLELAASLMNLQSGPDGTDQIMSIIKKGVLGMERVGDEIELDLEVLDNETLWKLHSFVDRSRKKTVSTGMKGRATDFVSSVQVNNSTAREEEEGRNRGDGEEDIDIGEEVQATNVPCVQIEKDAVNDSRSSDCSSSSSSSSGSESSSSDSDSDSCSRDESRKC